MSNCANIEINNNQNVMQVEVINNACERTIELGLYQGTRGYSAYELAVQNGYTGTLQEWIASTSNYIPIKCAVDIIAFKSVTTDVNGELVYADSANASHYFKTCGITETSATVGNNANVRYDGIVKNDGWSFTPELPVFLGESGNVTQNPESGVFLLQLGHAVTANTVYIEIKTPIMRA